MKSWARRREGKSFHILKVIDANPAGHFQVQSGLEMEAGLMEVQTAVCTCAGENWFWRIHLNFTYRIPTNTKIETNLKANLQIGRTPPIMLTGQYCAVVVVWKRPRGRWQHERWLLNYVNDGIRKRGMGSGVITWCCTSFSIHPLTQTRDRQWLTQVQYDLYSSEPDIQ